MWRGLHSLPGLASFVLVAALALSGAALAVFPVLDRLSPFVQPTRGISIAALTDQVSRSIAGAETIKRTASGGIVVGFSDKAGIPQEVYVDAITGKSLGPVAARGGVAGALKTFHRSLSFGNNGRILSGVGAAMMVLLSLSGVFLMTARLGGFNRLFGKPMGKWPARMHTATSRLFVVPLVVSAVTGIYIVLTAFELVPVAEAKSAMLPESVQRQAPVAPGALPGLTDIPLAELRSLRFPAPGDARDVFTVKTTRELVLIDQFSGRVLERVPNPASQLVYGWVYAIHSGEGLALVGLLLGLAALSVPFLGITGATIWWQRIRANGPRIQANHAPATADTVVLVGSEGGVTWGFARALHRELTATGHKVHVASMNSFRPHYAHCKQILFLTSTYGNGSPPASANRFPSLLADVSVAPAWSYAVLGFGDRVFPHFCKFAKDLDADLANHGWRRLLAPDFINRQSTQAFATWGTELAKTLGIGLSLRHEIQLPQTQRLTLTERAAFGEQVQAPTAILTFRDQHRVRPSAWGGLTGKGRKSPAFAPGELLGVLPPGSQVPRYYSIASAPSDDTVEICVKRQAGGECSAFLHKLEIDGQVECFVAANPDFCLTPGRKPVIMVSAGTGIAPHVGMIRDNVHRRAIHLFWGGRSPASDFLFEHSLKQCLSDGRLTTLTTAFSRTAEKTYVQDKVREQAAWLARTLQGGASIMVCGGDAMARSVMDEFEILLKSVGLSVLQLKSAGRYLEEVF